MFVKIRARLESRVNDLKGDSNDLDDQLKVLINQYFDVINAGYLTTIGG